MCFFKKKNSVVYIRFEEKIKQDIKQILQELAEKPKVADKVAIEGVVEALVEQKKEKDSLWSLLAKWNKLVVALSSASVIIAGISIFIYLAEIGSRHLWGDIVSQPSVFLAVVVLFAILMLFVSMPVYMPLAVAHYVSDKFLKENAEDENVSIKTIIITFCIQLVMVLFISECMEQIVLCISRLSEDIGPLIVILLIYLLVSVIGVLLTWFFNRKYVKNIKFWSRSSFALGMFYFLFNWIYSIFIIFALSVSGAWFEDATKFLCYIIISMVIVLLGFYWMPENAEDKEKTKIMIHVAPLIILLFFSFWSFGREESKFKTYLFQNLGYIEMPAQSRWYLIDNRFIERNVLRKHQGESAALHKTDILEVWKNRFRPLPPHINTTRYQYPNSFYGYMAWNLGEIKIFCPQSVGLDKSVADKCLYIKGDYLQPLPNDI
ncbi:hypothetical protein [Neisseria dentiae]